jgi:hypothetical protein
MEGSILKINIIKDLGNWGNQNILVKTKINE